MEQEFDAITKKVDMLKEEAKIASAKEKEAFYNFKGRRWSEICAFAKETSWIFLIALTVVSFFGSCCYGCYISNTSLTDKERLAKEGFREVMVEGPSGVRYNRIEKIPDNEK